MHSIHLLPQEKQILEACIREDVKDWFATSNNDPQATLDDSAELVPVKNDFILGDALTGTARLSSNKPLGFCGPFSLPIIVNLDQL